MESEWKNIAPDDLLKEYNEGDCTVQDLINKYGVTRNKVIKKLKDALS